MDAIKHPDRFYSDPGFQRILCCYCKHYQGRTKCKWYKNIPDDLLSRSLTDSHDCGNGHHFEPKEEEAD